MSSKINKINQVERIKDELKRGMPVIFEGKMLFLTEYLTAKSYNYLTEIAEDFKVIISKNRARFLFDVERSLSIDFTNINDAAELAGVDFVENIKDFDTTEANKFEEYALSLAYIAERLPSVIIGKFKCHNTSLLEIGVDEVSFYKKNLANEIRYITKAPVKLRDSENTVIAVFRAFPSSEEHYAIIVGKPEEQIAPLVRIHSSCYTGDLLASRRCDCGEQLDGAIKKMADAGGGIILYLMQEGRGIGLANKLRAYDIQQKYNKDTVEANEALGFEDDFRSFDMAAQMLDQLDISAVTLLTNNPRKIDALKNAGISVERSKHKVETHEDIENYINTKYTKLGHID